MLDEEIARAVLIGDGRDVDDPDKIKDPVGAAEGAGIRSILYDHELYVATVTVDDAARLRQRSSMHRLVAWASTRAPVRRHFYTTLPSLTSAAAHSGPRWVIVCGELLRSSPPRWASASIVAVEVMEREPDRRRHHRQPEGLHDRCRQGWRRLFLRRLRHRLQPVQVPAGDPSLRRAHQDPFGSGRQEGRRWSDAGRLRPSRLRRHDDHRPDRRGCHVQAWRHGCHGDHGVSGCPRC